MTELIPAILAESREEFENKIRLVEPFAQTVQIDVMNGTWTPGSCWADPHAIAEITSPVHYELHLMVSEPIEHLDAWVEIPAVKRVIFHIETVTHPKQIIEAIRFHGWEVGVAISPETPLERIADALPYVDEVLFLAVEPGASGRPFEPQVMEKIRSCATENTPHTILAVDGAISAHTIPHCVAAGATRLVVNSSLFRAQVAAADAWRHLSKVAEQAESALH